MFKLEMNASQLATTFFKSKVKGEMRKVPLYKFLNDFLDLP